MSRVFGIGLSRTGTTSLNRALQILGYRAVHFPSDPETQREIIGHVAQPANLLKLTVLERHDALTDTPVSCVYQALDRTYPGSKFVYTMRAKESWLRSCELWWRTQVMPLITSDPDGDMGPYMARISETLYGTVDFDAGSFSAAYDAYTAGVLRFFNGRPQDLLVIDICGGERWSKLAPFLGRGMPRTAFPRSNAAAVP